MTFSGTVSRQCTGIAILDDSAVENTENFFFSITSTDLAVILITSQAQINIMDDTVDSKF